MFDLDAYLERIGLRGSARTGRGPPRARHERSRSRTSTRTAAVPVSLELGGPRAQADPRAARRLLLRAEPAAESGARGARGGGRADARARSPRGARRGRVRPRGHLVLRVQHEGRELARRRRLRAGTLLEPLPFGAGEEHEQSGWRFRVVEEGEELVLQTLTRGRVDRRLRVPPRAGADGRPRDEQLVHLRASALAVRHGVSS